MENEEIKLKKEQLRDKLFNKYFEEDGILAIELLDKLYFIKTTWEKLNKLCMKHIKYFDQFSSIELIKLVNYEGKRYLILKERIYKYVIIDIDENRSISNKELESIFKEEFFIENFNERKENNYPSMYSLDQYRGEINDILDFYNEFEDILTIPNSIYYSIKIDEAITFFYIDFAEGKSQLGFETPDQFLYEQLFLRYNLEPSSMQDAVNKIGLEKIQDMFKRIKEIKLPISIIPKELYELYLKEEKKLIQTKNEG